MFLFYCKKNPWFFNIDFYSYPNKRTGQRNQGFLHSLFIKFICTFNTLIFNSGGNEKGTGHPFFQKHQRDTGI